MRPSDEARQAGVVISSGFSSSVALRTGEIWVARRDERSEAMLARRDERSEAMLARTAARKAIPAHSHLGTRTRGSDQ